MTRDDERLLWIIGLLLLAWWAFGRAGFRFSGGVGPIGASFGVGTSQFTNGGAIAPWLAGGCCCGPEPTGPITGDFGNFAQG
jgi:hypothetical protein